MKQSVFCQYHGFLHDLVDDGRAPVSRSLDHVHELDCWFTSTDEEVVECTICGDQWGVA